MIPYNLSLVEADEKTEVFLKAYQTLFWIGQLRSEETVMIHAGGSGVGTAAIQLAKQIGQAHVVTTAGSKEKLDFAQSIGADGCINYKEQNFAEKLLEMTKQKGADLILDCIGATD